MYLTCLVTCMIYDNSIILIGDADWITIYLCMNDDDVLIVMYDILLLLSLFLVSYR